VHELVQLVERDGIRVLLAASYFSSTQIAVIAERTGLTTVQVALGPAEITADGYFDLVDDWVERLVRAAADGARHP
jgi:ABC-type Zn uptake system ZnuABC Zn-binding protein ZnuA